jgi:hypothetical protein
MQSFIAQNDYKRQAFQDEMRILTLIGGTVSGVNEHDNSFRLSHIHRNAEFSKKKAPKEAHKQEVAQALWVLGN